LARNPELDCVDICRLPDGTLDAPLTERDAGVFAGVHGRVDRRCIAAEIGQSAVIDPTAGV
jgi:hypothetical protein